MTNQMTLQRFYIGLLLGVVFLTAATWASSARAESPKDILLICNKGVQNASLTTDEVRAIFLKQRKNWNGGAKIIAIHSPEATDLRVQFQKNVLGMQPEEELIYWFAQQARGKGGPPIEFRNTLKAVFKISGAISYVFRQDYKEGVAKILLVVPAQ